MSRIKNYRNFINEDIKVISNITLFPNAKFLDLKYYRDDKGILYTKKNDIWYECTEEGAPLWPTKDNIVIDEDKEIKISNIMKFEDIDYDAATKIFPLDKSQEIINNFDKIIKFIDENSIKVAEYKDLLSSYKGESEANNDQIDQVYTNLDLVNKNISDLKSNLDSVNKLLKDYINNGQQFIL